MAKGDTRRQGTNNENTSSTPAITMTPNSGGGGGTGGLESYGSSAKPDKIPPNPSTINTNSNNGGSAGATGGTNFTGPIPTLPDFGSMNTGITGIGQGGNLPNATGNPNVGNNISNMTRGVTRDTPTDNWGAYRDNRPSTSANTGNDSDAILTGFMNLLSQYGSRGDRVRRGMGGYGGRGWQERRDAEITRQAGIHEANQRALAEQRAIAEQQNALIPQITPEQQAIAEQQAAQARVQQEQAARAAQQAQARRGTGVFSRRGPLPKTTVTQTYGDDGMFLGKKLAVET